MVGRKTPIPAKLFLVESSPLDHQGTNAGRKASLNEVDRIDRKLRLVVRVNGVEVADERIRKTSGSLFRRDSI